MAIPAADLVVKFGATGVNQTKAAIQGMGREVDGFAAKARAAGKALTIGLTAPLIGFGAFATQQASDLAEATSAATVVYGNAADFIIGKSRDARKEVFLSREQYLAAATTLGVFGQSAGLVGRELGTFSNDLIGASADIASFYNVSGGVPEVLEAMRAGLSGESEPLRRFGIFMTEAAIQAHALEQGIWDGSGAMTEQQKILARQSFILANLGAAQGDAARTAGGLANQQRQFGAGLRNVAAIIGRAFLPPATKGFGLLNDWLDRLEEISPGMQRWAVIVGVGAAALGPLLVGLSYVTPGFAAMGAAIGFALSPIGLLIVAGGALAFLFRGELADAVGATVGALGQLADYFGYVIDGGAVWNAHMAGIPGPLRDVALAIGTVVRAAQGFVDVLVGGGGLAGAWQVFLQAFDWWRFREAVDGIVESVRNAAVAAGSAFRDWAIDSAAPAVTGWLADNAGDVWGAIAGAAGWVWNGAVSLGRWTLTVGIPSVAGWLAGGAGAFAGWLRGKLWGGALAGDGTGGPSGSGLTLGDWVLTVGIPSLSGWIFDGAKSIWDWLKEQAAWDGGDVALGPWTLVIGDPNIDLALERVEGWVQRAIDRARGANAELREWRVILSEPTVQTEGGGPPNRAWWEHVIGIAKLVPLNIGPIGLTLTVANVLDSGIPVVNDALQAFVRRYRGWQADMPSWAVRPTGTPFIDIPLTIAFGIGLEIGRALDAFRIVAPLVDWRAVFGVPEITVSRALTLARLANTVAGWASFSIEWTKDFALKLPVPGFPSVSWGTITAALEDLIGGFADLSVDWGFLGLGFDLSLPTPEIGLPDIVGAIGQAIKDAYPDGIDIDVTDLIDVRFNLGPIPINPMPFAPDAPAGGRGNWPGDLFGGIKGGGSRGGPDYSAMLKDAADFAAEMTRYGQLAGQGFANTLGAGMDAAGRATTNTLIGLESLLSRWAGNATRFGLLSGQGFQNAAAIGFSAAATHVTVTTLANESRLSAFAGQATRYGIVGGQGWDSGLSQGFRAAEGAARAHTGALRSILAVDLSGSGYGTGRSYSAAVERGLRDGLAGINAAGREIRNAAAGAANDAIAQLSRASELTTGLRRTGV